MKTNLKKITLAALPLALFLAAPTFAQMGAPPNQNPAQPGYGQPSYSPGAPQTPGSMNQMAPTNMMSDSDFAKDAAEGGLAEVKLGELAEQKGSSDTVKNFGKRMVEDHTQANDKLQEVASQENMKLPENLDKHDQKVYHKLSQLSGAEFDRAYAHDMVRDHKNDVAAFQQEANDGQDRAVKSFASQTLPTLQDHLKMAKQMEKEVASLGGTSAKASGNQ